MLTLAAKPLGFDVVVLDSSLQCPAGQVGADIIVGGLYDQDALQQLADRVDVVTVEIEHLDADALETIARAGKPVHPAPGTIKLIQDKYNQKLHLQKHGVAVAPFVDVSDKKAATQALKKFGGSMVLKAKHGAYDGRGNALVKSPQELDDAWDALGGKDLYAESVVDFTKELSVIIARDRSGKTQAFDVVEMHHERNICLEVIAPAQITKSARAAALKLANQVGELLEGAGVFAIEMFLARDGSVLVNEIAPRVHNSGHHSIESCKTSQFEQHIRAISGLPLGDSSLSSPAAVMINILGTQNAEPTLDVSTVLADSNVYLHWYGKSPIKVDRKMGHITVLGDTVESARTQANKSRRSLNI